MAELETSLAMNCSPEAAFEFLVRPKNLLKIIPTDLGFSFLEVPEQLELGSRIEFQITGYGPVQRFLHEVISLEHPTGFTEHQVTGPLKRFVHEHVVESNGSGEVWVIDRVEFEPPGGLAGFLLTEKRVRESLETGLWHRLNEMKKLLEQE